MENHFDNHEFLRNISNDATRISQVKFQRNIAIIVGGAVITVFVIAVVVAMQEERKKGVVTSESDLAESANLQAASNELVRPAEEQPGASGNYRRNSLGESWDSMVVIH